MVDREELKRFLLHPEPSVREFVARYFRDSWDQGEDVLPLILDACVLYGDEVNHRLLSDAVSFPVNRESLAGVIGLLKRVENKNIQIHAGLILAGAPTEILKANEAEILSCPNLPDHAAERIRRRLEFSGRSGEDLWEELRRFATELDDVEEPWSRDLTYADDLVEELAARETPNGRTICELLQSAELEGLWLELFLVDLAGARRLREAIPALVAKLRFDDDALLESVVEGLARIGGPEAVRRIRETFHRETWDFRLLASDLLGTIKHPESEDAILALLPGEDDETIRTDLCFSLCQLLSERGVETVKAEIASDYDRGLVCLEDVLLDVAVVLGISLPEAETWYAQREEQKRARAERLAKIAALEDQGIDPFEEGDGDVEDEGDEDFEDESDEDLDDEFEEVLSERFKDTVPFVPDAADYGDTPFRRSSPKIGRNEPCPCGSGKKHKKCCGKKT
jgi:hypothetical protein